MKPIVDTTPDRSHRIDPGGKPSTQKINAGEKATKKPWRFSFKYWRQIRYFGFESPSYPINSSWFVALLEKFTECCKEDVDVFLSNGPKRDAYRFHEINWNQKGIPIKKTHLDWVDSVYLNNNDDYPFVQFQLSTGLGRVAGFFDEDDVFNVVLLDPLHNLQPSKFTDYKARNSRRLTTDLHVLLTEGVRIANSEWCKNPECTIRPKLLDFPKNATEPGVVLLNISSELYDKLHALLSENKINTLEEHLELALMLYEDGQNIKD